MATVRKNQKSLSQQEWAALVAAINSMHGTGATAPAYRTFVNLHVEAMSMTNMVAWGVHYMGSGPLSNGRNFLAWHRRFLQQFEKRLGVALPYWDWVAERALPAALTAPALLRSWSVTRHWNSASLPTATDVQAVMTIGDFPTFQFELEGLHDRVHNAVGGNMSTAASPSDPLFFLHHANIDRLWDQWQQAHPGINPPNVAETLRKAPLEGVKVPTQLSIAQLGYSYA